MLKSNEKQLHSPKIDVIAHYSLTKWLTQGLWGCLFIFYNFYIYIFYFVSQVLCICTDDRGWFSMRNVFCCNDFIFFYLIIWWEIGIASELKLEILKDGWLGNHNCFYYFLLLYLIILFYYYNNIQYSKKKLSFISMCG
jgi:hypothetical protein